MAGFVRQYLMLAAALGLAACASPTEKTAEAPAAPAVAPTPAPQIPRLANGKPNFQGNWFKARGYGAGTGRGAPPPAINPGAGPPGDDNRAGGPPRDPNAFYIRGTKIPYTPEALRERRWRAAHGTLDGEPLCQLAGTPRNHEQPPYPHMIIQDEKQIVILYEYVHEPRIVPLDGTPHMPSNYRTWLGDSRGRWEGDTLVIETKGYNGRVWLNMEGDFLDENLSVVEKFTMKDANTYDYEATLTDPTVYTEPLTYKWDHRRQPDTDQLLSYDCLEGEDDVHHYTAADGGQGGLKFVKQPATVYGCLRGEKAANGSFSYTVTPLGGTTVKVTPADAIKNDLPELIDREVKFDGRWNAGKTNFSARYADVHATGCRWDGKPD